VVERKRGAHRFEGRQETHEKGGQPGQTNGLVELDQGPIESSVQGHLEGILKGAKEGRREYKKKKGRRRRGGGKRKEGTRTERNNKSSGRVND
jgi:hypothetical protein